MLKYDSERRKYMTEITLQINGMSCKHCVMRVKKAVDGIDGVTSSDVEIGKATVKFDEAKTSADAIKDTVKNTGYTVTG